MLLGVNIDHIATLREARKINDPNPLDALSVCKLSGADQITIHLREDRRHIHDLDAKAIIEQSALPVNLECSINSDIIDIVCNLKPYRVTLVPENRAEVTTEGGLDLENNFQKISRTIEQLKSIELSNMLGASWVELHTGTYANIYARLNTNLRFTQHSIKELELPKEKLKEKLEHSLENIKISSSYAVNLGLKVAAGHGLNYQNVRNICEIKDIIELNIGQSIIARSVFTGLSSAIVEMKNLISK